MFYVKLNETEHAPGQLVAANAENLWWSRHYVPAPIEMDSEVDPDVTIFNEVAAKVDRDYSIAHIGDMTPQHSDDGRTVNWVWWVDLNVVGHLLATTQEVFILNANGKTVDRV